MIHLIYLLLLGLVALVSYIWGYRNCSQSFRKCPLIKQARLVRRPLRTPRHLLRSIPAGADNLKSYFDQPAPHQRAQKTWYGANLN